MAQAKQPGRDKSLASLHKATDTLSTMLAQEVKELNATLQYVALGFGLSVIPPVPINRPDKVRLVPIAHPQEDFRRTVYFAYSKTRPLSPLVQRMCTYIRENADHILDEVPEEPA